jgi:hypothetical protein
MIGECNGCNGSGEMFVSDKPTVACVSNELSVDAIVSQVADAVPVSNKAIPWISAEKVETPPIEVKKESNAQAFLNKLDGKKPVYKHKKG